MAKKEINRLFVYGTLKEGFHNHHLIDDLKQIAVVMIRGYMFTTGGFPILVLHDTGPYVQGEVYTCDDKSLMTCDNLERHPIWYYRQAVRHRHLGPIWVYTQSWDQVKAHGDLVDGYVTSSHWHRDGNPRTNFYKWIDGTQFTIPDKPHAVFDPEYGVPVINQSDGPPLMYPSVASFKNVPIVGTPPVREKLPLVPEEAKSALKGLEIKWA